MDFDAAALPRSIARLSRHARLRPDRFLGSIGLVGALGASLAAGLLPSSFGARSGRVNLRRGKNLDEFPHAAKAAARFVDDRERPREGALGKLEHLERAPGGLMLDRRERHDRHSLSDFDRPLDGLRCCRTRIVYWALRAYSRKMRSDALRVAMSRCSRRTSPTAGAHAHLVMLARRIVGRDYQHQFVVPKSDRDDLAPLGG